MLSSSSDEMVVYDPGPSPLRRLSAAQYLGSLRALFPSVELPDLALVEGAKRNGLTHLAEHQVPSALWVGQIESAASLIAGRLHPELARRYPCIARTDACHERELRALLGSFFRRPARSAELAAYRKLLTELADERENILEELALVLLQDPAFLYFDATVAASEAKDGPYVLLDPYALASRLSYFLWNIGPDEELLARAEDGSLLNRDVLLKQAERLLLDDRGKVGLLTFAGEVYELERISEIVDKHSHIAAFTPTLRADMREELERNFVQIARSPDLGLRDWLAGARSWVSPELAGIYGVASPSKSWEQIDLPASQRAGLLTSAGFLAAHAVHIDPAPVRRGVFVLSKLLCRQPTPPNSSIDTTVPEAGKSLLTNRQRYEEHSRNPACASCHEEIDGLGFGFENYDAVGQYREMDLQQIVDARGKVELDGRVREFEGAVELAGLLASSKEVHACSVRWWLSYALARELDEGDAKLLQALTSMFISNDGNIRTLILEIVGSDAFRRRRESNP